MVAANIPNNQLRTADKRYSYRLVTDPLERCKEYKRTKAYTDIYVNKQQLLLKTTLFYTWRHVSAAHTAIFRPAYNRTGPFMCAQYGITHCLHIKYM